MKSILNAGSFSTLALGGKCAETPQASPSPIESSNLFTLDDSYAEIPTRITKSHRLVGHDH